jgi:phosphatidylglycerophosphate synthase
MFDITLRRWIDRPLMRIARTLHSRGIKADQVTLVGFGFGIAAALAIATGYFHAGLGLIALNRLSDDLDGALARITRPTDRGAFLDIALDFVFYASIPLAFAVADPVNNALPAAALLAAFLANGAAFLAFAVLAAKRGLATDPQERKSIYYLSGLAEGAETILVFGLASLWPAWFAWLAWSFAALTALSASVRFFDAWHRLK